MGEPAESQTLYLGLMSGTSMDGIDAALVGFGDRRCDIVETAHHRYPTALRARLASAVRFPESQGVDDIGDLDRWVGECFRDAAQSILNRDGVVTGRIAAIGSHGQTIRHQPRGERPYTMQIGDPNVITAGTGITTVADFRRADLAAGGEGAPLVPAFHQWLFADGRTDRVVLNVGGIANVTVLPAGDRPVTGFDTGPGNTLLDAWVHESRGAEYDENGDWAASGAANDTLLRSLLRDPYFAAAPPKSTGPEYFNLDWLRSRADDPVLSAAEDVQATLSELTARTVADSIREHAPATREVLVCGGGVHNADLMERVRAGLDGIEMDSVQTAGLDPDWVEAAAFAWLARRRIDGETGNLPSVTGASRPVVLGGVYPGGG